ncbi:hypothetical protein SRRS_41710 [Sporomusa rhizae]|uniref:carboxypeptidase regulatory-like domain-containing protein n=1 Tax=Sporomusa rhizae TaxID=357999 RepID=UPI00352A7D43
MVLSKRISKLLSVILSVLMLLTNSLYILPAYAEEINNSSAHLSDSEKVNQFVNQLVPYFFKNGKSQGPEWLKTTDFNLTFTEDYKPIYSLETIQPFGKVNDNGELWFWQGRYAHQSDNNTANLGIGWRKISADKTRIVGVNTFYDYGFKYNLSRVGIGTEYFKNLAEYRFNYYLPLSGDKQTDVSYTDAGILRSYIRAVEGFDYEVGTALKNAQWLKFYASGFYYDNKYHEDETGYRLRNTMQITPRFSVELGYIKSNQNGGDFYGKFSYQLADKLGPSLYGTNKENKKQDIDLSYKLLQKVERNNTIKTETFTKLEAYTGSIKVSVTNSGNKAIQGVLLQAYQNGSPVGSAVRTDASGTGVLSGLSVGTYTVRATYFNNMEDKTVTVQKDQTASTEFKLPIVGGSMVVNVLNAQGQPVAGATVTAHVGSGLIVQAERSLFDRLLGVKTAYAADSSFTLTGTSGADGRVIFTDMPAGDYRFTVMFNNQAVQSNPVNVPPSGGTGNVDVIVDSGAANNGYAVISVQDGSGVLSGATVSVNVNGSTRTATTDSAGKAIFSDLPAGNYTFTASKTYYNNNFTKVTIHNKETAVGAITLTPSGGSAQVTVAVMGGAGIIPNFTVDGAARTAEAVSGNVYIFRNLTAGNHTIDAWYTGYSGSGAKTVSVVQGTTVDGGTITLTADTGSAKVTVVFAGGSGTPSFTVDGAARTPDMTSGNIYTFNNLIVGSHSIDATCTGFTSNGAKTVNVAKNGTSDGGIIALTRDTGSATITVKDGSGAAVAVATVSIDGTALTATTDASGVATFSNNIPTGTYTFTAIKIGYTVGKVSNVTVSKGATATPAITITRDMGSAAITVKDGSGALVEGATVSIDGTGLTATTNASGVAMFSNNIPTGTYTFTASKTGYTAGTVSNVAIIKGATATPPAIEITRDTGSASITVKDGSGAAVAVATVSIDGTALTATTDASGVATFSNNIPTGTYTFTANKTGYAAGTVSNVAISKGAMAMPPAIAITRDTGSIVVTIVGGSGPVSFTVDGVLRIPDAASGNVYTFHNLTTDSHSINATCADYTSDGPKTTNVMKDTAAGVTLNFVHDTGSAKITVALVGVTGITPNFTVDGTPRTPDVTSGNVYTFHNLMTGSHSIAASYPNCTNDGAKNINVTKGTTVDGGTITLTADAGSAKVTVSFAGGSGTPSFLVDGTPRTADLISGGTYTFNNLMVGSHSIDAACTGFTSDGAKTVCVTKNGTTDGGTITLTRDTGSIAVTIVGGSGPVSFTVDGANRAPDATSGNVYTFHSLPTGSHTINATCVDYTSDGPKTTNVMKDTAAGVTLSFVRDTGSAKITVALVGATGITPNFTVDGTTSTAYVKTGDDYMFHNLTTGNHTIAASYPGFTSSGSVPVTVSKPTPGTGIITLTRDTFNAKITVTDGNSVVKGATVTIDGIGSTTTDNLGVATFSGIPTNTTANPAYMVRATKDGYGQVSQGLSMTTKDGNVNLTLAMPVTKAIVTVAVYMDDTLTQLDLAPKALTITRDDNSTVVASGTTSNGTYTFTLEPVATFYCVYLGPISNGCYHIIADDINTPAGLTPGNHPVYKIYPY